MSEHTHPPSQAHPPRTRRAVIACMHCRRRQVRCARSENGGPRCQRCERMNLECEYVRASEMQTPPRAMLPSSQAAHHFDQSLASYAQSHHGRHTDSPGNVHHAPYGSFNGYSSGHITHSTSATPPQFSLSQSNLPWTSQPTPELDAAHYGTAQYTDVEDSKAWYIPNIASTGGASRMHASPQPVTWGENVWRSNDTPVGPNAGSHSTQHIAPFYGTQGTNPGYSYDPYTAMGYSSSNNA